MKCQAAQRLLSAERDGALDPSERAALQEHLADCSACQQIQAALNAAVEHWRAANARVAVPDVERAWQDIRRQIRTTAPTQSRATGKVLRWTLPVAAAGALAAAFLFSPRSANPPSTTTLARFETPHADYVEVPSDASSLVYVDDQSGWLVVWAVNDDAHKTGG